MKLNDQINTVLGRYDAWKKGDYEAAKNPIPKELSNANAGESLIDFDDSASSAAGTASGSGQVTVNELESLFGPSSSTSAPQPSHPQAQTAPIFSVGMQSQTSANTFPPSLVFNNNSAMMGGMVGSPSLMNPTPSTASSPYHIGTSTPSASNPAGMIRLGTPQLQSQHTGSRMGSPPSYFGGTPNTASMGAGMGIANGNGMSGLGGMGMSGGQMNMMTPQQPAYSQQSQQPSQSSNSTGQAQKKDPFADLAGLF